MMRKASGFCFHILPRCSRVRISKQNSLFLQPISLTPWHHDVTIVATRVWLFPDWIFWLVSIVAICGSKNQMLFASFTLKYTLSSLVTALHVVVMSSWVLLSADSIFTFSITRTLCCYEIRTNGREYRYGNGPWTYIVDGYVGRGIRVKEYM